MAEAASSTIRNIRAKNRMLNSLMASSAPPK